MDYFVYWLSLCSVFCLFLGLYVVLNEKFLFFFFFSLLFLLLCYDRSNVIFLETTHHMCFFLCFGCSYVVFSVVARYSHVFLFAFPRCFTKKKWVGFAFDWLGVFSPVLKCENVFSSLGFVTVQMLLLNFTIRTFFSFFLLLFRRFFFVGLYCPHLCGAVFLLLWWVWVGFYLVFYCRVFFNAVFTIFFLNWWIFSSTDFFCCCILLFGRFLFCFFLLLSRFLLLFLTNCSGIFFLSFVFYCSDVSFLFFLTFPNLFSPVFTCSEFFFLCLFVFDGFQIQTVQMFFFGRFAYIYFFNCVRYWSMITSFIFSSVFVAALFWRWTVPDGGEELGRHWGGHRCDIVQLWRRRHAPTLPRPHSQGASDHCIYLF